MGLRWSLLLLAAAVALLSGDASAQVVVPQCYSTRNLPGETNPCKHSFDAKFDFTNTTVTVPGGKKNPAGTSYSRFCITLSTTRPCNPADSMCCPAAVPVTSSSPSVYELQLFTRSECVEKGAGNTELKKIRFYLGDKKISPGIDKKAPALTFRRSWWGTNKLCFEIPLDGQGVTPCSSLPLLCSADGCKLTLVTKPFDQDGKTGPKKKTGCKMSSGLEYDCTATCTRPGFKCNAANLCIPYVPPPTTGDDCSNGPADICKVQCLNGGTCLPPDSCDCTGTGYSGPTCNIRNCTGFAVNAGADQTVTTGTVNITVAVTPAAFTPADISFTFTPATAGAACVAAAGAPGVYTCSGLPNGKTTINVTATKDVCVTSDTVDITVTPSGGGCTDVAVSVVPAAANVVNGAIDVTITLGASLTGATPVVTVTPSGTCAVKAGNVYTCTGLATGQSTISASATLGDCKGSGSVVVSTSTGPPGCDSNSVIVTPSSTTVTNGMVVVTVTLGASLSGATPVLTVTPAGTCSPKVGQDLVYECTGLGSGDSTITATASVSATCSGTGSTKVTSTTDCTGTKVTVTASSASVSVGSSVDITVTLEGPVIGGAVLLAPIPATGVTCTIKSDTPSAKVYTCSGMGPGVTTFIATAKNSGNGCECGSSTTVLVTAVCKDYTLTVAPSDQTVYADTTTNLGSATITVTPSAQLAGVTPQFSFSPASSAACAATGKPNEYLCTKLPISVTTIITVTASKDGCTGTGTATVLVKPDCPKYTITAVSTDKDSTVIADGTNNLGTGHIKVTLSPALVGATVTFSYSKPGVECKLDAGSQTDYTCTGLPIGDTTISIKACKDGCTAHACVTIHVVYDCPKSHTITVKAVTPVVNSPTGSFEVTVSQALDGATLNITSVPTGAVCTAGAKTGLTTIYTCTGLSRDVNTVTFQATKDGCDASGSATITVQPDCSTYTIAVNPPEEAVVPGDVNNKGTITFGVTLSAPLIAAKAIPTATVDKAGATCTVTPVVAPADGKFTVTCSNLARDLNIITIEAKADGCCASATKKVKVNPNCDLYTVTVTPSELTVTADATTGKGSATFTVALSQAIINAGGKPTFKPAGIVCTDAGGGKYTCGNLPLGDTEITVSVTTQDCCAEDTITVTVNPNCADGYKLTATPATQSVVAGAGGTGTADVTITRSPSLAGAALTFGPNPITCTRKGVTDVYTCTNIQPGTNVITVSAANDVGCDAKTSFTVVVTLSCDSYSVSITASPTTITAPSAGSIPPVTVSLAFTPASFPTDATITFTGATCALIKTGAPPYTYSCTGLKLGVNTIMVTVCNNGCDKSDEVKVLVKGPFSGCYTRTNGFWKNRGAQTQYFVDGLKLWGRSFTQAATTKTDTAQTCALADPLRVLCVKGQSLCDLQQLGKQCMAALINARISSTCSGDCFTSATGLGYKANLDFCCGPTAPPPDAKVSTCIGSIDNFNQDKNFVGMAPLPADASPADQAKCPNLPGGGPTSTQGSCSKYADQSSTANDQCKAGYCYNSRRRLLLEFKGEL